jgi:hypothetical protein
MQTKKWTFKKVMALRSSQSILIKDGVEAFTDEFYAFYIARCKAKKISAKDLLNKQELVKVKTTVLKTMRTSILNNLGGVLIKNFGYFYIFRYPYKRQVRRTTKVTPMLQNESIWETGFFRYQPMFIPFNGDSEVKFFSMDYSFTDKFTKELKEKLRGGHKYYSYAYTIKPLLELSEKLKAYRKKITYIKWLKTSQQ